MPSCPSSSFASPNENLSHLCPSFADFPGMLPLPRTQHFCGLVDARDKPIAQRRSCVTNSRRGCGDGEGGDAAIVECGQPRDAGVVLADTCVVEDRSKAVDAERLFGIPADQPAM